MNIYLAIITTVLVVTQIIRVCQNHAQLRRQRIVFEKQLGRLADCEPTKEDFETQRKAYRLIVEHFEGEGASGGCHDGKMEAIEAWNRRATDG